MRLGWMSTEYDTALSSTEEALSALEEAIRTGDKNAVAEAFMNARRHCEVADEVVGDALQQTQRMEQPRMMLQALQMWKVMQQQQQQHRQPADDDGMKERVSKDDVEERMRLVRRVTELEKTLEDLQKSRKQEEQVLLEHDEKSGEKAVEDVLAQLQRVNQQFEESLTMLST